MAIIASSSFQDEAREAAMGQDGEGEGVEVLHHEIHQILLLLDLESLQSSPSPLHGLATLRHCTSRYSILASKFELKLAAVKFIIVYILAPKAFVGVHIELLSTDGSVTSGSIVVDCCSAAASAGEVVGDDEAQLYGGAAVAVHYGGGSPWPRWVAPSPLGLLGCYVREEGYRALMEVAILLPQLPIYTTDPTMGACGDSRLVDLAWELLRTLLWSFFVDEVVVLVDEVADDDGGRQAPCFCRPAQLAGVEATAAHVGGGGGPTCSVESMDAVGKHCTPPCSQWWDPVSDPWDPPTLRGGHAARINAPGLLLRPPTSIVIQCRVYPLLHLFIILFYVLFLFIFVLCLSSRASNLNYPSWSPFATKSSRWTFGALRWEPATVVWGMLLRALHALLSASSGSLLKTCATATCNGWHAASPRGLDLLYASIPTPQPSVLSSFALTRQLLLRCWFDDCAPTWVIGMSFFYFRQRLQPYSSVVGMLLLQWLHRPTLYRRYVRSVHPGARVFDAPAYTPRWQNRSPLRPSRCYCFLFWSQDLNVIRSSLKDLYYVIWLP